MPSNDFFVFIRPELSDRSKAAREAFRGMIGTPKRPSLHAPGRVINENEKTISESVFPLLTAVLDQRR